MIPLRWGWAGRRKICRSHIIEIHGSSTGFDAGVFIASCDKSVPACPSCCACSSMGTASAMQIMAEAMGFILPGAALMPAAGLVFKEDAYLAGKRGVYGVGSD